MGYEIILTLAYAFLRALRKPELDILVVGAGGGAEIERFLPDNPGWRLSGVDPSQDMLDLAAAKADRLVRDRVKLIRGTVDDAPGAQRFDAATCLYVLHFLHRRTAGTAEPGHDGGRISTADTRGRVHACGEHRQHYGQCYVRQGRPLVAARKKIYLCNTSARHQCRVHDDQRNGDAHTANASLVTEDGGIRHNSIEHWLGCLLLAYQAIWSRRTNIPFQDSSSRTLLGKPMPYRRACSKAPHPGGSGCDGNVSRSAS
jgi:SAM-dependent methyltransferase